MSKDQVRWKTNALMKKCKECINNVSKSGRGMDFEWFEQMEEILEKYKNAGSGFTGSSSFSFLKSKSSTSTAKTHTIKPNNSHRKSVGSTPAEKPKLDSGNESSPVSVANENLSVSESSLLKSNIRHTHGTGSKVARAKVELEKQ